MLRSTKYSHEIEKTPISETEYEENKNKYEPLKDIKWLSNNMYNNNYICLRYLKISIYIWGDSYMKWIPKWISFIKTSS